MSSLQSMAAATKFARHFHLRGGCAANSQAGARRLYPAAKLVMNWQLRLLAQLSNSALVPPTDKNAWLGKATKAPARRISSLSNGPKTSDRDHGLTMVGNHRSVIMLGKLPKSVAAFPPVIAAIVTVILGGWSLSGASLIFNMPFAPGFFAVRAITTLWVAAAPAG